VRNGDAEKLLEKQICPEELGPPSRSRLLK
jgi:hypothetical protein